MLPSDVINRR